MTPNIVDEGPGGVVVDDVFVAVVVDDVVV